MIKTYIVLILIAFSVCLSSKSMQNNMMRNSTGRNMPGMNMPGMNMSGMNMSGMNMSGMNMSSGNHTNLNSIASSINQTVYGLMALFAQEQQFANAYFQANNATLNAGSLGSSFNATRIYGILAVYPQFNTSQIFPNAPSFFTEFAQIIRLAGEKEVDPSNSTEVQSLANSTDFLAANISFFINQTTMYLKQADANADSLLAYYDANHDGFLDQNEYDNVFGIRNSQPATSNSTNVDSSLPLDIGSLANQWFVKSDANHDNKLDRYEFQDVIEDECEYYGMLLFQAQNIQLIAYPRAGSMPSGNMALTS
jgi:hypothetical protein